MLIVIFRLGLFLGEHDDVEGIFAHPLGGISQGVLVFADVATSFPYGIVLPLIAGQNVVDGLGRKLIDGFTEDGRHAGLPLHQRPHAHHEVLAEALEEEQKVLYLAHIATVLLEGLVDLLEKVVAQSVDLLQHLTAAAPLRDAQLVVLRRHFQRAFEHSHVGEEGQIGDAQITGHHRLVVDAYQRHEVFHATDTLHAILLFLLKYVKQSHMFLVLFGFFKSAKVTVSRETAQSIDVFFLRH